ncbi:MAG: EAL domain-containing protein [Cyanobacteria bacterium P01_F01_bin.86]
MSNPVINVLIIEDSEDDSLIVIRELQRNGFRLLWERVETAEALKKALAAQTWDVIISDYTLPQFDAPAALKIVSAMCANTPFIVVAGSIGEYLAVDMMKAGAHDYVMKDSLARLPEAVRRELRDAKIRTERAQAELAINRQLAAIETAIDGIGIIKEGIYTYVNRSYLMLFGYEMPDELLGKRWQTLYPPEQTQRFSHEILPHLACNRAWQGEAIAIRQDGTFFAQGLSLSLTEDDLLICVCRDISELKQAQELLIHNALHDPLTNLPNRNLLIERLELAINRAKQSRRYGYAVLFLDLDRFKMVNDSLGHVVGDQLLVTIAQRLIGHTRNIDVVARLGGDEFVILLEDIKNTAEVVQVTERILAETQIPLQINNHEIFTSFSIGIVLGKTDYSQATDLLRDADIAMYQAKNDAHNSYRFFNAAMHTEVWNRLALETDLRKALDQQEFTVYYQPIIELSNRQIIGFEALLRWQHPTRGLIIPDEFIPIAEETGFITIIDNWVLHQACQQIAIWQNQFPHFAALKISVNLSAQDLSKVQLVQQLDEILNNTGLSGDAIILEITESLLIKDIERIIDLLMQLTARQIRISIDDFGTGYSSLNYLHRLPAHSLKVDRSFVAQMEPKNRNYKVVNTIVGLGQQLGLTTIAEGIETIQQLELLKKLGCQFGQGYLFSHPLSAQDVEAYLFQDANVAAQVS